MEGGGGGVAAKAICLTRFQNGGHLVLISSEPLKSANSNQSKGKRKTDIKQWT